MNDKIRVFLVDDHTVVREGLKRLIDRDVLLKFVGEADSLMSMFERIHFAAADVMLLDLRLPDGDGIDVLEQIKDVCPNIKILLLSAFSSEEKMVRAIRLKADGYILKTIDGKEMIKSIKDVYNGRLLFDTKVLSNASATEEDMDEKCCFLNPQESKVLSLIGEGKTNKEIASSLFVQEKTIRNHVTKIFHKIDVTNRTEAALYWIRCKR